jgi:hypothetical protein
MAVAPGCSSRRGREAKAFEVKTSMTDANNQTSSVTKMIGQVLERGEIALVVTAVSGPG